MLAGRTLVAGSSYRTPIESLDFCGASCHPGPGVTFLPGFGCAMELARAMERDREA